MSAPTLVVSAIVVEYESPEPTEDGMITLAMREPSYNGDRVTSLRKVGEHAIACDQIIAISRYESPSSNGNSIIWLEIATKSGLILRTYDPFEVAHAWWKTWLLTGKRVERNHDV